MVVGSVRPWPLTPRDMTERPDTQWPRYYVFERPRRAAAMLHVGSVHGSDPEIALLNARDVFARRPDRQAMWVARADKIYSQTREQMVNAEPPEEQSDPSTDPYHIFQKSNPRGASVYVGKVIASDHPAALRAALNKYEIVAAWVYWVIADPDLIVSHAVEADELYESASDKPFRHENHFPVRTLMREIMRKRSEQSRP